MGRSCFNTPAQISLVQAISSRHDQRSLEKKNASINSHKLLLQIALTSGGQRQQSHR